MAATDGDPGPRPLVLDSSVITQSLTNPEASGSGSNNMAPVKATGPQEPSPEDIEVIQAILEEDETPVVNAAKNLTQSQVLDVVAAATAVPSLRDFDLTSGQFMNLPQFNVYLMVNGQSFSCPSVEFAEALKRPVGQSLEHKLSGLLCQRNYSSLTIQHCATGMGVYNSSIGQTQVAIKDIKDFRVEVTIDHHEKLDAIRKFQAHVKTPPYSVSVISFTTSRADHNVDMLARASLSQKPVSRNVARPQLDNLKSVIESESELHFEMLVLPKTHYTKHLNHLETIVPKVCELENQHDPLEIFFSANDQSKKCRTIQVSQVPDLTDSGNAGQVGVQPPMTRYINEDQRMVMQVNGMVADYRIQEQAFNSLNHEDFKVALLPCKHVDGNSRCIAIVFPESRGHLLPKNGDHCLVNLQTQPRERHDDRPATPVPMTRKEAAAIARSLQASLDDCIEDEEIPVVISQFFGDSLSDEEVQNLGKKLCEDVHEYLDRMTDLCLEKSLASVARSQVQPPHPDAELDGSQSRAAGNAELNEFQSEAAGNAELNEFQSEAAGNAEHHDRSHWGPAEPQWDTQNGQSQWPVDTMAEHHDGSHWGPAEPQLDTQNDQTQWPADTMAEDGEGGSASNFYGEDGENWCHAQRVDMEALRRQTDWQVYLVRGSKTMREKDLDFKYAVLSDEDGNKSGENYLESITAKDKLQPAQFRQVMPSKPIKAMVNAVNSLRHPESSPTPIQKTSQNGANYCLRFQMSESVDLFKLFPSLDRVRDGSAPTFIMEAYNALDESKKEAFHNQKDTPDGVSFVSGVAGCGKTTYMEFNINTLYFGDCGADAKPGKVEHDKRKVLWCVNNNVAVDTAAKRIEAMFAQAGHGSNAPAVIRLYGMDSEVDRMPVDKHKPVSTFNRSAAVNEMDSDEFAEVDRFLAGAEVSIHDEQTSIHQGKNECRNMSLQHAALAYHNQHPAENEQLQAVLESIRRGDELTREQFLSFKIATKTLYRTFLKGFNGIVCCTPMSAANFQLRSSFTPDMVFVDEGGRLHELELMMLIAWYPGPWIIVGDKFQLPPFVHRDPSAKDGEQSRNPWINQISYSTLARAVDAGATESCLRFNHRALGDLYRAPSSLIYRGFMDNPNITPSRLYTPSVRAVQAVLRRIQPNLKKSACSLLVSMPGSWVGVAGTSSYNLGHVRWAIDQVVAVLRDPNFRSSRSTDGDPGMVLVMAYYRAQLEKYLDEWRRRVRSGEIPGEFMARVKFSTLDSSQGIESDFCVIDLVSTDFVGFTDNENRLCLTLTRARQGQIILASAATFLGTRKSNKTVAQSGVIRRMFSYFESARSVASVPVCVFCEMPNAGHEPENCPGRNSPAVFVACQAPDCKANNEEHNAKTCPRTKCHNCRKQGHRTSECPDPIPCANCLKAGHTLDQCPKSDACHFCQDESHRTWECEAVCKICQADDHGDNECPKAKCFRCGYYGHDKSTCTFAGSKTCKTCGEAGHIARNCPSKPPRECFNCGETGHVRADCTSPVVENGSQKPLQCDDCGGNHRKRDCSSFDMTQSIAPNLQDDDSGRVDLINSALDKLKAPVAGENLVNETPDDEAPFAGEDLVNETPDDEAPVVDESDHETADEGGDLESAEANKSICGERADFNFNFDGYGNPATGGSNDGWI